MPPCCVQHSLTHSCPLNMLCCNDLIYTHTGKRIHPVRTHTHTCRATLWHCELTAFYSSHPALTGFKPPLSLSPRGCLLMRDAVKCTVTFSYGWNGPPEPLSAQAFLLVLCLTVESQILYSPFHMIGSFMVFSLIVDFFHDVIPKKQEHNAFHWIMALGHSADWPPINTVALWHWFLCLYFKCLPPS